MGNGFWLGRRSERIAGKISRKSSGSSPLGQFAALAVLLLTASALLISSLHPSDVPTSAQLPVSPLPSFSRSSLSSNPSNSRPLHSNLDARAVLGQLPLIFEPNRGQADPRVKFLARGAGYSLFLDSDGAVLAMQTAQSSAGQSEAGRSERFVRMKLVGANAAAATAGTDSLPGKSNYIMGNDPRQWHTGIAQFAGVRYRSVYRGIDLVFYGNEGRLEYDFQVAPGADPA